MGGDAMRGPATVVEGIADAQRFADIVIGAPHTLSVPENAHVTREEAIFQKRNPFSAHSGLRGKPLSALQYRLSGLC